jgi:uncharacterized protein YcbK (DUF882 family)
MIKAFFISKIILLSVVGFFATDYVIGFYRVNDNISLKVKLVKESLTKAGYKVNWFVISGKRSPLINSLLRNASKNSHHLRGNAIDVCVLDIDGDFKFTQRDLDIIKKHNRIVEAKYPKLRGGLGTYTSRPIAKRMVHFDTGGYSREFNK